MGNEQATAPVTENAAAAESTAKDGGTLLTGAGDDTTSLTDGGPQKLPHAWMGGLTSEQKADADLVTTLSKFEKGIPDLSKAYAELEKKLGQAVTVPNEKATEEEKARYRKAIGVPEKPEDYKLEKVELPAGFDADEAMQGEFLKVAHGVNLSTAQANAIHGWYMKTIGEQVKEAQVLVKTTTEEATAAVHKKHGVDSEAAITYMERGFKHFATPELAGLLKITGLGNHPEMVDLFIKAGKLVNETPFVDGSRGERQESGVGNRTDTQIAETLYPSAK